MNLSTTDKVRALRELTIGAPDVFACFAVGDRDGGTHWRPIFAPLQDAMLIEHLRGHVELGSYPLIPTPTWPTCRWICADFDGKRPMTDWQADVQRLVPFLMDFDGCPVFVNLSRSGQGAHVRMLFREPVPAWMARRWLFAWLKEAGVVHDDAWDRDTPSSFDRLIPPQDTLKEGFKRPGQRYPGNLAGSPLQGAHARSHGGTLPLDPERVARGDFEPDGKHWHHVMDALERRDWGEAELRDALDDAPEDLSSAPPANVQWSADGRPVHSLPVVPGTPRSLDLMLTSCAFVTHMARSPHQDYHLWVAMASQLHRFGEAGKEAFHEISKADGRYNPSETEQKWNETRDIQPMRCDTLVRIGWTCPHLDSPRCNGCRSPTYFGDWCYASVIDEDDLRPAEASRPEPEESP